MEVEYLILLASIFDRVVLLACAGLEDRDRTCASRRSGFIMDMLSQATEKIARESYYEYANILKEHPQPVYYGRVLRETDERVINGRFCNIIFSMRSMTGVWRQTV
jgi:hypothetical protein